MQDENTVTITPRRGEPKSVDLTALDNIRDKIMALRNVDKKIRELKITLEREGFGDFIS